MTLTTHPRGVSAGRVQIAELVAECPSCHYTSGHWAYCKDSTREDWQRLPEPFASSREAQR